MEKRTGPAAQACIDEVQDILDETERIVMRLRNVEFLVAGTDAAYFRTARRLFATATSALDEMKSWLDGISV